MAKKLSTNSSKGNAVIALSKTECVRNALAELGQETPAAAVGEWIAKKYKMTIPGTYLSVVVSNVKKKMRNGTPVVTRKGSTVNIVPVQSVAPSNMVLDLARKTKDFNETLGLIKCLKEVDLVEAEKVFTKLVAVKEITGDNEKALQAYSAALV